MNDMNQYISKSAIVAELERRMNYWHFKPGQIKASYAEEEDRDILSFIDTLVVIDPYEQCVQYDSIKAGIQDHAETYSFNIESMLFPQLTKEQQELWRKEIEQACISGGDAGVELARDRRYKENLEAKEVDLDKEIKEQIAKYYNDCEQKLKEADDNDNDFSFMTLDKFAKYFFELGLRAQERK